MEPIVKVSGGPVRGSTDAGVTAFLGVPYAAAPVGAARYAAPQPVESWDGVREATELGATCVQAPYPPPIERLLGTYTVPGAEYLNVNVWTPDPGGSGLPVMVWIHGGAFVHGSNAVPVYNGSAFARDGVVLVSVNYRLGASGFAVLDGAPANRGLLDQLFALEWVQDNIAAFGGDPGNVTVFGESAGGMSVASLLGSTAASGLFHRAIMQSGNTGVAAIADDARLLSAELAAALGISPTAAAFAEVEPSALLAAQERVHEEFSQNLDPARWGPSVVSTGLGMMSFFPVLDGQVLSERPIDAIRAGSARGIPVIAGSTTEEFRLFTVPTGLGAAISMEALPFALARFGVDASFIDAYAADRPEAAGGDLLAAIVTDAVFRSSAKQLVETQAAQDTPAYLYEFAWRRPDENLGAIHALDVPFTFDTLAAGERLTGPNAPQRVADEMHGAWVAFAKTGDPGWPIYGEDRQVMTFDAPKSTLVANPRPRERAVLRSAN